MFESGLNEQTYNELVGDWLMMLNPSQDISISFAIALSQQGHFCAFVGQQWGEIITVYPQ